MEEGGRRGLLVDGLCVDEDPRILISTNCLNVGDEEARKKQGSSSKDREVVQSDEMRSSLYA